MVGERARCNDSHPRFQFLEKRRRPEVACLFPSQPRRVAVAGVKELFLASDLFGRVVRDRVHVATLPGDQLRRAGITEGHEFLKTALFVTIL